ncbi:ABC transporter permease [Sporosarcina thermotolerans]|uniref:ABC transporter permease n=1 Tax=Sporosarcina thermotolerans TaxID=633404 RepID=A0AAW9ABB0_9BACL|nr:ABC transporter permease [Sporosarcina thermotolerans]MDW0118697.1 ABC transporter permease [Sporosarcina thermotolerans]WHT48658.1 ABC transporter permease [Sporosarcina thermotolerans]
MLDSYKREWIKLFKHPSTIWLLFFFSLFIVYSYVSVGFQFQNLFTLFVENSIFNEQQTIEYIRRSDIDEPLVALLYIVSPSMAMTYSLAAINTIGPIVFSVTGALLFGVEYRHSTILQLWNSGLTKVEILVAKLFSLLSFVTFFIIIYIILGFIMSYVTPIIFDLPMGLVSSRVAVNYSVTFLQISGTILSLLLWAVFAACITVVSKSLSSGIIVGFFYPIIESSVMHNWTIGQWFPLFVQKSMLPILFKETAYGGIVSFYPMPDTYTLAETFIGVTIYIILLIFLMLIVLRRQRIHTSN